MYMNFVAQVYGPGLVVNEFGHEPHAAAQAVSLPVAYMSPSPLGYDDVLRPFMCSTTFEMRQPVLP